MKRIYLLLMLAFASHVLFAQKKGEAEKLIADGANLHDKGDYEGAIKKYDSALELDKNNLTALSEKAISLLLMQKYNESIECCKQAIATHPSDKELKSIYVTYGTAYDGLQKTDKSIEVYNEGLKQFPDSYTLYFNKGVSLAGTEKYDEAILCFQKAIIYKPDHASSHNAIGRLLGYKNKHIPSLLAYCRFLVLEPESKRAKEDLESMQKLTTGSAEKTGKNTITINVSSGMLGDTLANGKSKENNFGTTDLMLAMTSALDYNKENKNKKDVEKFIRKFETVCASLSTTKKDNFGFYWDYYVPYFIEMQDKNFIETFAYVIFATSDDKSVAKWLKGHQKEIEKFYLWSSSYVWKKG